MSDQAAVQRFPGDCAAIYDQEAACLHDLGIVSWGTAISHLAFRNGNMPEYHGIRRRFDGFYYAVE